MKKHINRFICAIALCLLCAGTAAAQSPTSLSGVVTDENGAPFAGVSVTIRGTSTGTTTNAKGEYSLPVKKGDVVQFSFAGYNTEATTVNISSTLNMPMSPQVEALEEVIVIGYGTVNKKDLTGSVASLGSKDIATYKTSSVVEAMGGQLAGVQVTQMDGSPGSGFDIKIRGTGSMSSDAGPMYVVDGFQVDNIDYLANSDIVSMDILKDASASAIYGARGANGVVIITTRGGKSGKPVVSFSASANYREISNRIDVLNPYEFVKLQTELDYNRYASRYFKSGNDPATGEPYRYQSLDDYIGVKGVDWQDEVFKPTWSQDYNASISGGNSETKYNFAFSRYAEDGLFKNSSYDKTTAKLRLNQRLGKKVTLDMTVNYVNTDKQGVSTSGDGGRFNMLAQVLQYRPTGGLEMTDYELLNAAFDPMELEFGNGEISQVNPIKQAESVDNRVRADLWQANGSLSWEIIKGLTFKTAGTYSIQNQKSEDLYKIGSRQVYAQGEPYGQTTDYRTLRWINFNYLTYKKIFNRVHSLEAMLGQEANYQNTSNLRGQAKNLPTDVLGNNNLGMGTPTLVSTGYGRKTLASFFGRATYGYDNRYMITATLRRDGSSVFSEEHKWGWFPSFSLSWRIDEEKFMEPLKSISTLKIRGGWGVVGNDRIPTNLSLALYQAAKYGIGGTQYTSFSSKQLPNHDLRWEGSASTNIGLDFGMFNDRITLTADIFRKDTKDLIIERKLPQVTGFDYQWQNIGKIRNEGIELTLRTINFEGKGKGNFRWTTDFNITFIRNSLQSLAKGLSFIGYATKFESNMTDDDYMAIVGQSLGMMYGYQYDGVYQVDDFNINAVTGQYELKPGVVNNTLATGGILVPGTIKYRDLDGDGKVTTADRTKIGNGTPKFFGGFNNSLSYMGFDLGIMLQFQYGNDVYNATRMFQSQSDLERVNRAGEIANRWTMTNPTNDTPSATGYIRYRLDSRFIEDGSFLRLKNLTLGYTLPAKILKKTFISRARIYATGSNLFVVSNYKGYDPEVSVRSTNPLSPGLDWGAYPRSRVYTVGIDLSF